MSANSNFLDVSDTLFTAVSVSLCTGEFTPRQIALTEVCARIQQKACELVKQAIDADVKQDWAEAFKLYKSVYSRYFDL
jgi:vacuolar protein-sorting-associated protein 4